jgi:hypothetical protein
LEIVTFLLDIIRELAEQVPDFPWVTRVIDRKIKYIEGLGCQELRAKATELEREI